MTESYLRGAYQTLRGNRDSHQAAFDQLREQAIHDGLGAVVRDLDEFCREPPVKPQVPETS